jgi:hypothetical protein
MPKGINMQQRFSPSPHPTNLKQVQLTFFYHRIPFINRKRRNKMLCAFGTCAGGISLVLVKDKMFVAPFVKG